MLHCLQRLSGDSLRGLKSVFALRAVFLWASLNGGRAQAEGVESRAPETLDPGPVLVSTHTLAHGWHG